MQGRHFINPAWALGQQVMSQLLDENALDQMSRAIDVQLGFISTKK